jgi:hypothetical protein
MGKTYKDVTKRSDISRKHYKKDKGLLIKIEV